MGTETVSKLKTWQNNHGLEADGICGVRTRNKMNDQGYSWDQVKHFERWEFACPCCGFNAIDIRLVLELEGIRSAMGDKPVHITSGCRCSKHNKEVGGVMGSKHLTGGAADFYISGVSTKTLLQYCQSLVSQGRLAYTYTNSTNMSGAVHINI